MIDFLRCGIVVLEIRRGSIFVAGTRLNGRRMMHTGQPSKRTIGITVGTSSERAILRIVLRCFCTPMFVTTIASRRTQILADLVVCVNMMDNVTNVRDVSVCSPRAMRSHSHPFGGKKNRPQMFNRDGAF